MDYSKQVTNYLKEIQQDFSSVPDLIDSGILSTYSIVKYMIRRDYKRALERERLTGEYFKRICLFNDLAEKYHKSVSTVKLYIFRG